MARDPALEPIPEPNPNAGSAPDRQPIDLADDAQTNPEDEIDKKYWEQCLADGERAEADWRSRGRDIIKIYRNDGSTYQSIGKKRLTANQTFNILYSNTEVMAPAVYAKPPAPVVRSRFVKKSTPPLPLPPPPPMLPPGAPPMGAGASADCLRDCLRECLPRWGRRRNPKRHRRRPATSASIST